MTTRSTLGSIFASIGVLAIGWQLGSAALVPETTVAVATTSDTGNGTSTPQANDGTTSGSTTASATTTQPTVNPADGTWTGNDVNTRFGSVQVQVTISGGAIADVTPLQLTDHDRRSVDISNRAAPALRSEVLTAQSASVNTIGGATYTSDAYLSSLQSALDQAGF